MRKILFVRGHNTFLPDKNSKDVYYNFKTFCDNNDMNITYVNYNLNDDIREVYNKVCDLIRDKSFDFVVGHSMGGCLLTRYIFEHDISKFQKVVLLMPLIYKEPNIQLLCNMPFVKHLHLPKLMIYPENKLWNEGNIMNDTQLCKLIPVSQIADCYNHLLLTDEQISKTLNKNKNCILFYASQESFVTINPGVLDKIKNKIIVEGKHECFNEIDNSYAFFKLFKKEFA